MRQLVAAQIVLALSFAGAAAAQQPGDRVRLLVGPEARDAGMHEGRLRRLGADSVVLEQGSGTRVLARADVARLWVRGRSRSRPRGAVRYGLPLGALGALVGYTLGSSRAQEQYCPDDMLYARCPDDLRKEARELAVAGFAVLGGAGAFYGATAGSRGWVPAAGWRGASLEVAPMRIALTIPLSPR